MSVRLLTEARTQHRRLIASLAAKYEREGYIVQADEIGHPNGAPPIVNGFQPDLAAYRDSLALLLGQPARIAEAETCDSLNDEHTRRQWQAFSRSRYPFDVIVPRSCLQAAEVKVASWGVRVDRFYHFAG